MKFRQSGNGHDKLTMERKIRLVGGALALLLLGLFLSDGLIESLRNREARARARLPKHAQVLWQEAETRIRTAPEKEWRPSVPGHDLRTGDALFTGRQSKARVALISGGVLALEEMSLVDFTRLQEREVPRLEAGVFRLKGDRLGPVGVGGRLLTFEGTDLEIEIRIETGKEPVLTLLAGSGRMDDLSGESRMLTRGQELAMGAPVPRRSLPGAGDLQADRNPDRVLYHWKLHDLYETREGQLIRRDPVPDQISLSHEIQWTSPKGKGFATTVHHSPDLLFASRVVEHRSVTDELNLGGVFTGENYWRASGDGRNWSKTQRFIVETDFFQEGPSWPDREQNLRWKGEGYEIPLEIEGRRDLAGLVVEISPDPGFEFKTESHWVKAERGFLSFTTPGVHFARIRGVSKNLELTAYSKTKKWNMVHPAPLPAPTFGPSLLKGQVDEQIELDFNPVSKASGYEVQIFKNGLLVEKRQFAQPTLLWVPRGGGVYTAHLRAIDRLGLRGRPSRDLTLQIFDPRAKATLASRDPASVGQSSFSWKADLEKLNTQYKQSQVRIEAVGSTMFSTSQQGEGINPPQTVLMSVRALHWWGPDGIEAGVKTQAASFNETASDSQQLQAEARVHRRWLTGFPFRSLAEELQVSVYAGLEIYRNTSAVVFSPRYDLLKLGMTFDFPLARRWESGGEIGFGYGLDASMKYELSGFLNYHLVPAWSLGAGYRVHLFEAGTEKSAPAGLPYKEAYGEGYSVLRWHYE